MKITLSVSSPIGLTEPREWNLQMPLEVIGWRETFYAINLLKAQINYKCRDGYP